MKTKKAFLTNFQKDSTGIIADKSKREIKIQKDLKRLNHWYVAIKKKFNCN